MSGGKPKRDHPWAVRGVSEKARAAAAVAAKQAGLSLGAWLDRVVRDAASEAIKGMRGKPAVDPTNEEAVRQLARDMLDMKMNITKIGHSLNEITAAQQGKQPGIAVQTARPTGKKPK